MAEALEAARSAWASPDLSGTDEQAIWARYGASFSRADHDRRVDALLFAKRADDAARFLPMASPQRQAAFGARIAMQRKFGRCREPLSVGHRHGHQRRRADDGSRALPSRQQLRSLGAAARGAPSYVRLSSRRPRAVFRAADRAGERRRAGSRLADRLQHHPPDRRRASGRRQCRRSTARDPRRLHDPCLARRKHRARPHAAPGERGRDVSTVTPAPAARSRSRPRAIIGRAGPRWRRDDLPKRTPISSAQPPIPSCSTASSRSNGLAGRSRRPRKRFRKQVPRSGRRSTTAGSYRRCACCRPARPSRHYS